MENKEIVFNLWYLIDKSGMIFNLKAKAYVAIGNDEQKLAFLNSRALLDYDIAKDYDLPHQFKLIIDGKQMNCFPKKLLDQYGGELVLFDDVIDELEKGISKFCPLKIPGNPLVSITPLQFTDDFKVIPFDKLRTTKI